jgi:KTSC domain-containing protein
VSVDIRSALDGGEGIHLEGPELVERIEALPWKWTWVESSTIARVAWCETSKVPFAQRPGSVFPVVDPGLPLGWLWVQFRSGEKVYAYQDVPRPLYAAIIQAGSPGGAHNELIKGRYRYCAADLLSGRTFTEA